MCQWLGWCHRCSAHDTSILTAAAGVIFLILQVRRLRLKGVSNLLTPSQWDMASGDLSHCVQLQTPRALCSAESRQFSLAAECFPSHVQSYQEPPGQRGGQGSGGFWLLGGGGTWASDNGSKTVTKPTAWGFYSPAVRVSPRSPLALQSQHH